MNTLEHLYNLVGRAFRGREQIRNLSVKQKTRLVLKPLSGHISLPPSPIFSLPYRPLKHDASYHIAPTGLREF